eukprot:TRINITY_DN5641_c0_g1_i2.p1 TRINITY_DN5641_c0_g1~~TRINITY_DN5641_c0_g1_i2.p1  ORF type:complete len:509 (-),score=93.99 TRINITY_DN5641_c0_g1_i2:38-1531(-)
MATALQQFAVLLKKNFWVKIRNRGSTIMELIFPLYFVMILVVLQQTVVTEPVQHHQVPHNIDNLYHYCKGKEGYCIIGYAPSIPETDKIMLRMEAEQKNPRLRVMGFMNEETLISYHKNSTVQNALWGAVTFNSTDLYGLTYSLRIDETRFGDFPPNSAKRFGLESGYVALEKAFIQALINVNSAEEVEIRITSARNFLYTTYNTILLNVLPFYLPFIFGYSLNTLLVGLLNEKHKKLKEMMKMAGLSEWIYVLSWFTTQLIMLSIAAMVFTCVGFIAEIFSHSNFFIIYMAFILYGINLLATGFALSTLFENPRMGGAVAGIVQMFCVCGYAVLHFVVFPMEGLEQIKEALHLIPIVTLGEFAYRLGESESKQLGVGWEEGKTLGWLLLDAVIMFLLYSWMVHVIPGNTGTTRGPLFFLDKNFWFPKYVSRDSHESILEGTPMEVASLLGNEDGEAEITIKELVKIFNEDKYCATIKNKLGYAEIGGDKDDRGETR